MIEGNFGLVALNQLEAIFVEPVGDGGICLKLAKGCIPAERAQSSSCLLVLIKIL